MPYTERQLNGRYSRSLACVEAEFSDLPAGSGGKEAADGLNEAFEEIQQKDTAQASSGNTAKAGTGQRTVARVNLKEWRKALARTANIASVKIPGFNSDFPPPHGESDDELLSESRAVAPKAVEKKAEFTKRGMEDEYVTSGDALIVAFEEAFDISNEALSHRGAATGGKASAYKRAAEFFDELDIYIRNKYRDQPGKINAWNIASRLERSAAKKNGGNDDNDGENSPPPTQ